MRLHFVMDTETWGKRAGCDARSIGVCLMDPNTGLIGDRHPLASESNGNGVFYRALHNDLLGSYCCKHYTPYDLDFVEGPYRRYNLHRDKSTVEWWHSQTEEAIAAFDDSIDLKQGLSEFSDWLKSFGVDPAKDTTRIWGHGAAYDPPIVEAWFQAVGLPLPYHYRSPRDTRTAFDMVGIEDHTAWMTNFRRGVFHHARDDALTEAYAIAAAHELRGMP